LPDSRFNLFNLIDKVMQHKPLTEKLVKVLQQIELVTLRPCSSRDYDEKLAAARACIAGVLEDFLAVKKLTGDRIFVIDAFLFLFNEPEFSKWHMMNWWDQRKCIQAIKDSQSYSKRAHDLLNKSRLAAFLGYSDEMVAKSTDQEVKRAWMRKRLVLQECFWNTIDSVSHAAYFHKKYQEQFPALCLLLCNFHEENDKKTEMILGIDNGTGFLYKKKSRESAMIRLLYKIYKFFFRSGVFYIGGLQLGLLETDSELSCHGSGAVVYQGW